jgi:hypothetical protein
MKFFRFFCLGVILLAQLFAILFGRIFIASVLSASRHKVLHMHRSFGNNTINGEPVVLWRKRCFADPFPWSLRVPAVEHKTKKRNGRVWAKVLSDIKLAGELTARRPIGIGRIIREP